MRKRPIVARVEIDLQVPADDPDAIARWARHALKLAGRVYRLRCVSQTWEPIEPPTVRRPEHVAKNQHENGSYAPIEARLNSSGSFQVDARGGLAPGSAPELH